MSAAEPSGRTVTLDEYRAMPDDPRYRCELVRGWVVREPRPGEEHGWIVAKLAHLLMLAIDDAHPGRVVCDSGFLLQQTPPTVRGPDVAFMSERCAPTAVRGYPQIAPDLVAEVLSPSNRAGEMRRKVREFFAAGAHLVWLVDPRTRTVTVHVSPEEAEVLRSGDELTGGEVLPLFRHTVASLFI